MFDYDCGPTYEGQLEYMTLCNYNQLVELTDLRAHTPPHPRNSRAIKRTHIVTNQCCVLSVVVLKV